MSCHLHFEFKMIAKARGVFDLILIFNAFFLRIGQSVEVDLHADYRAESESYENLAIWCSGKKIREI